MASLFDVLDGLQTLALATSPALSQTIDVAQGWPQPNDVDTAMQSGRTLVSIYPVPSTTSDPGQPMNWGPLVVTPPVIGMTVTVLDNGFALSGSPGLGEYVTVVLGGRQAYSATAQQGDTPETLVTSLASQIGAIAAADGAVLAFSSFGAVAVRLGAPGTLGDRLHRQRQQFRVVVWAPSPADRAAVASAVDVMFKRNLTFALPDGSSALLTYQTLNLDDRYEVNGCYRADLMWSVTWDTLDLLPGYEITAVVVVPSAASADFARAV